MARRIATCGTGHSTAALLALVLVCADPARAQLPREQLQQLVIQLQQTPADTALRTRIITLAVGLKPAVAVPEEAREPFVMGTTALKRASDSAGASRAVDLFSQALNIAPWFADAYYNRAVARQTAGQFEAAIDDLKLYLAFKVTDDERREAQDRIYSLKADAQIASDKKAELRRRASAEQTEREAAQAKADETRKREEERTLQRRMWAQNLVRWMTENYGRSLVRKVIRCDCTDEEARGSNWSDLEYVVPGGKLGGSDWSRFGKKFSFRQDGQTGEGILFVGPTNNWAMPSDLCGTVNGPWPEDISWKACGLDPRVNPDLERTVIVGFGHEVVDLKFFCRPDGKCSRTQFSF